LKIHKFRCLVTPQSFVLLSIIRSYFRNLNKKAHGKQGFVILTKSFVKIGITRTFCYNHKMFIVLSTKRLVASAKVLVAATKILSVVPNFVAVTKPFFPCKH